MLLMTTKALYFLLLLFLHISTNQARQLPNDDDDDSDINYLSKQFSEAPNYRNAPHCPALPKTDMSSAIHIATTVDYHYFRGTVALINSILTHTSCPQNLFFHFIASKDSPRGGSSALTRGIETTFPSLAFALHLFDDRKVNALISPSIRRALDAPLNYARVYLPELIVDAGVRRVVYLDSDTVVVDDIESLWRAPMAAGRAIAAPEYCREADVGRYFTEEFWSDWELSGVFREREICYFNTGVMVVDLARWREGDYTARLEKWMRVQRERRIYELGSLPPFLLVFGGEVEAVHHKWNQHGLGGDNVLDSCRSLHAGPASLLHWSGKGKPWLRLDSGRPCPVDFLWAPYDLYIQ